VEVAVGPPTHQLEVRPDRRNPFAERRFEPPDNPVRLGERGVAGADAGVVRPSDASLVEQRFEVGRGLPDTTVELDRVGREFVEVVVDVLPRGVERESVDRDSVPVDGLRRPSAEQDVDGLDDFAAPEGGVRRPGDQLHLVGVVVEDPAELVEVVSREPPGDGLCDPVTE